MLGGSDLSEQKQQITKIFKRLFGYSPNEYAQYLLVQGKIIGDKGFKSQDFDKNFSAIATSSTVISCLLLCNLIEQVDAAKLLDEVSPPRADETYFPDEGRNRSMWAIGITAFAESLIGNICRSQLQHRIYETVILQNRDGGWSYSGDSDDKSKLLFSFYPILALINAFHITSCNEEIVGSLKIAAEFIKKYQTNSITEQLMQQYLAKRIRKVGVSCKLKISVKAFYQRMESINSISNYNYMLNEVSIPLFYCDIFVPSLYLLSREFYSINKRPNLEFAGLLRKYSCINVPAFSSNQSEGKPCVWSSALGLYTGMKLSRDISRLTIIAQNAIIGQILARSDKDPAPYKYDLAISFSGTKRHIARKIYNLASKLGYNVFFDESEVEKLVGKELTDTLTDIYMTQSRYVIIILSEDYMQSKWAYNIEWMATQTRALEERDGFIIPYRVDPNANLRGLRPTVGYLDVSKYSEREVVNIIDKKIQNDRNKSNS